MLIIFAVFISLVVSLVFCEIVVRIVAPQNLTGLCFEQTNKGLYVNRSKGSVKAQYGSRIVRYNYFYPHLRDTPLREGGIKILTVGDSFTFGVLLDKADVITSYLQRYADKEFGKDKFIFLNAATGGWGTADYVAFIEDFGEEIKPNIILVMINIDDIGRSVISKLFSFAPETNLGLKRNILIMDKFKESIHSIPEYEWLLEHSHLAQLVRRAFVLFFQKNSFLGKSPEDIISGPNSSVSDYAIKLGHTLFIYLDKWCSNRDVDLYISTTGWHSAKKSDNNWFELTRIFMSTAQEFFKSINVPFFDISPYMPEDKTKYTFPERHPNEEGAKLIADNVWRNFLKERLTNYLRKNANRDANRQTSPLS